MSASVDGIAALQRKLEAIASGSFKHDLYDRIGRRLHALVQQGWDSESDPYGDPWAPTTRANPILDETGAMRGSSTYEVTAEGITFTVADWKAAFHQYGTSRGIVPRKMLPDEGVPVAWQAVIQDEVTAFFRETFGTD